MQLKTKVGSKAVAGGGKNGFKFHWHPQFCFTAGYQMYSEGPETITVYEIHDTEHTNTISAFHLGYQVPALLLDPLLHPLASHSKVS